ncbi:MAG: glycosyltransferase family 4 protein [Thermoplasmata archaeon]|nr:glycosyltransferase family 4 protein [Thermoplasmata archaeon]
MRIRIAVHRFRPDVGGTELMAEMMAGAMASRGHDVEVVTLRTGATPRDEKVVVPPPPMLPVIPITYRVRRLDFVGGPIRLPVGYWRLLKEPTDVLHVFGNRIWDSDLFLPIASRLRYPKVLTGQNFYQLFMHPNLLNRFYAERYFPRAAAAVDACVVQTIQEREQFRQFGYRGRIELIPHTVDVDEFPLDDALGRGFRTDHGMESDLLLLSAGGYAPNKRMDRVIEGVARSKSRWHLVITGADWPRQPYDLAHCRALAQRLGVHATFLGDGATIPRSELIRGFLACDAYAQGSSYEGYGGAVQEAMTVRRPFVAFETGAFSEFASAGAGFAVRSVDEFAARLDELAGSHELRLRMGEKGRTDVLQHRSKEVTMAAYERLFREVGGRPPAG